MACIFSPSFRNAFNHMSNLIDAYQMSPAAKIDGILLEYNYLKSRFTCLSSDERKALSMIEDRIRLALLTENARKRALSFSQDEPMPIVKRSSLKNVILTQEMHEVLPISPQPRVILQRTYEEYPVEVPSERTPSKTPVGTPLDKLSPTLFLEERRVDEGAPESVAGEANDFDLSPVELDAVPAVVTASVAPAPTKLKRAETIYFDEIEPMPAADVRPVMPTPLRKAVVNLNAMEQQAFAQMIDIDADGSEYSCI